MATEAIEMERLVVVIRTILVAAEKIIRVLIEELILSV